MFLLQSTFEIYVILFQIKKMAAQNRQHDHLFKLLIIGDAGVGKSSILVRFADNIFTPSYITTIGVDFKIRTIELNGQKIKLQIWDTAGQERFRTITATYYRGAHGVLVVFDVTEPQTFLNVKKWLSEISNHCDDVPRVLVGNKLDAPNRVVDQKDAETYANQQNIKYFETSAKTNIGVEEMFTEITRQALDLKLASSSGPSGGGPSGGAGVNLGAKGSNNKKKCC